MGVYRLFVEKKPGFDIEAQNLFKELKYYLGLSNLLGLRFLNRYDVSGISRQEFEQAVWSVFAEANCDRVFPETLETEDFLETWGFRGLEASGISLSEGEGLSGRNSLSETQVLAVEYLPGQFDQRADSAAQCIQILTQKERPLVRTARILVLCGRLTEEDMARISGYYINSIESRPADLAKPLDLTLEITEPDDVPILKSFTTWPKDELEAYRQREGMAMSGGDLLFCQDYFRDEEKRDPTLTELKVIDTYWSDHCRHTTFLTELTAVAIESGTETELGAVSRPSLAGALQGALDAYFTLREEVYGDDEENSRPVSLMDMALIAQKYMKKCGLLPDLDESEEINACSIVIPVDVDGCCEPWLIQFKNETHNHPTEIEPFGGAATCLGGAIRDPLSGRAYVYQAMRVTGSADPRTPLSAALPGKLPQSQITTKAAQGYSSYGNQIGLATGQVVELYHPDYAAKRMEIGAVIGAVPQSHVRRERPESGDVIILVGGRTGRDGCGGATGSSKAHDISSLSECGAEVQKGDPPTERKIQRLFRNGNVSRLVKKCNDFGAGGVSVAIGELAEGVDIQLDHIPLKYQGLNGAELAISESQERMAVVLDAADAEAFIEAADRENLEATPVAQVNAKGRLTMTWRGKDIVNLSRRFLDSNGVKQQASALIISPDPGKNYRRLIPEVCQDTCLSQAWHNNLQRLEVAAQKGLVDMFDSTVGAGSVLLPFGGLWQLTPEEAMVAKIPLEKGETETTTIMSYGFIPALSSWSPCHGAVYAVVEALAKVAAVGGNPWQARLTLQEYFPRLGKDRKRWGMPVAALLGALLAQKELGVPAIGGKDSMSGSFGNLDVPPTLVCFAVAPSQSNQTVSAAFKKGGHPLYFWPLPVEAATELPDWPQVRQMFTTIEQWNRAGKIAAASVVREGGLAAALTRMALGNMIGAKLDGVPFHEEDMPGSAREMLFAPLTGSILLEMTEEITTEDLVMTKDLNIKELDNSAWIRIGETQEKPCFDLAGQSLLLEDLTRSWLQPLEGVFSTKTEEIKTERDMTAVETEAAIPLYAQRETFTPPALIKGEKPRVLIPVFPGTNGETDMARAFERSGAVSDIVVVRNLTGTHIEQSIQALVQAMDQVQMIAFPGGFSGGDEPDGSGKFIAALFRHEQLRESLEKFIGSRDGLIIGICNGFQALIKLGLLPGGHVTDIDETHPTLTFNSVGHHISRIAYTQITSVKSPWLRFCEAGQRHAVPVSHGEGRFIASQEVLDKLVQNGQVVAQYVDVAGKPSLETPWNPNGSVLGVEAVCSPDGHILGKMGHSERTGPGIGLNVPGNQDQRLFEAGISYFNE